MNFADGLRAAILADPTQTRRGKRILDLLDSPPSKRRERRLARMEALARAQLGDKAPKGKDWSAAAFDWSKFLEMVVTLLKAILPLLLAL